MLVHVPAKRPAQRSGPTPPATPVGPDGLGGPTTSVGPDGLDGPTTSVGPDGLGGPTIPVGPDGLGGPAIPVGPDGLGGPTTSVGPDGLGGPLPLSRVVGAFKSYISKAYGIPFQKNFFDTRIRDDAHYAEKWNYIVRNPVARELAATPREWPYVIAFNRITGEELPHR